MAKRLFQPIGLVMWINGHASGARELFARWAGPLLESKPAKATSKVSSPPVSLLGIRFESVNFVGTLQRIDRMIESRKPHYIATANVDFLVQARQDPELRDILLQAGLVLCDGTPLLWLSKFFGNALPERVAGSDLTPLLIERAARKGYRIFFLGGQPEVAAEATARLMAKYPTLQVAGHYSPPFKPLHEMDNDDIARRIQAARPDIVFVSFGCPKAEKWMAANYLRLGVPVMIGVGATIDFLAGRVKRAPVWMQRTGLEWSYRLAQEPKRLFRRYARDFAGLGWATVGQFWHMRSRKLSGIRSASSLVVADEPWLRLHLPSHFDKAAVVRDEAVWEHVSGNDCIVHLEKVTHIDSTGFALLLQLQKQLRADGCRLALVGANRRISKALRWAGLGASLIMTATSQEAEQILNSHRASQPSVPTEEPVALPQSVLAAA